ncbi:hypothetical protein ROZALSC1DRAFT_28057 [Rozella allomycis CSF55]|uniref:Uncharacterized protein n=1 Tax=Rozella allomycis (strain CSF55) TaxID=988480 RepID=A0A075AN15_ROZAC|nr:hypothetical protein O9G_001004 [Rozella allomycis CSF55]RKP20459.1 hypothetical protein ROZALSC1DRAFT_28057 [Rozella allomycis CSF55]|eukprot:EPZ31093.1 hypothetical protein O9G_001004 [Rozella allomycis CSF55]
MRLLHQELECVQRVLSSVEEYDLNLAKAIGHLLRLEERVFQVYCCIKSFDPRSLDETINKLCVELKKKYKSRVDLESVEVHYELEEFEIGNSLLCEYCCNLIMEGKSLEEFSGIEKMIEMIDKVKENWEEISKIIRERSIKYYDIVQKMIIEKFQARMIKVIDKEVKDRGYFSLSSNIEKQISSKEFDIKTYDLKAVDGILTRVVQFISIILSFRANFYKESFLSTACDDCHFIFNRSFQRTLMTGNSETIYKCFKSFLKSFVTIAVNQYERSLSKAEMLVEPNSEFTKRISNDPDLKTVRLFQPLHSNVSSLEEIKSKMVASCSQIVEALKKHVHKISFAILEHFIFSNHSQLDILEMTKHCIQQISKLKFGGKTNDRFNGKAMSDIGIDRSVY